MVIGYHAIFAAYGFWLPNDGRGSWSSEVWAEHLKPFGGATKVTTRRSLAAKPHDVSARRAAKAALRYPAVRFDGVQARAVARGFAEVVGFLDLSVYACAILPDHVHLVVGRHRETVEQIVGFLKRAATREMARERLHPLAWYSRGNGQAPSPWVRGGWKRYLDNGDAMVDAINYAMKNPVKMGFKKQSWRFLREYCGRGSSPGGAG